MVPPGWDALFTPKELVPVMSYRRLKYRWLNIFYELYPLGASQRMWQNMSFVNLTVERLGPHPDPSDTRQYPAEVIYTEPIMEETFVEFFRSRLARKGRQGKRDEEGQE